MNKFFGYAIFGSLIFVVPDSQAQVTIGQNAAPVAGALLQLTEGDGNTKGLNLPRVKLTYLTDIKIDIPSVMAGEELDHTGLIVYNINSSDPCLANYVTPGVYLWDGLKWIPTIDNTPAIHQEVSTFYDKRGDATIEQYKYRHFKTADGTKDAGVWMLENLRATVKPDGTALTFKTDYVYPVPRSSTESNANNNKDTYFKTNPRMGLLYNWTVATNDENDSPTKSQGQTTYNFSTPGNAEVESLYETSSGLKNGRIQGLCPKGWHLPSDREWNELEEVLTASPELYSTNSGTVWTQGWETSTGDRPSSSATNGAGLSFLSTCIVGSGTNYTDLDKSKSFAAYDGGFNVLLSGYRNGVTIFGYGDSSFFHTSSSYSSSQIWARLFSKGKPYIRRNYYSTTNFNSIRCKQDEI